MFTLAASSGLAAKVTLRQPARARSVACASTPVRSRGGLQAASRWLPASLRQAGWLALAPGGRGEGTVERSAWMVLAGPPCSAGAQAAARRAPWRQQPRAPSAARRGVGGGRLSGIPECPTLSLSHSPQAKGVEAAIGDAKAACSDGSTAECAAAWDVVEEISAAKSHDKAKKAVRARASRAPRAGTRRAAHGSTRHHLCLPRRWGAHRGRPPLQRGAWAQRHLPPDSLRRRRRRTRWRSIARPTRRLTSAASTPTKRPSRASAGEQETVGSE